LTIGVPILRGDDPDFRKGFAFGEAMLRRGVYVHPWHNMFLCAAMTEQDIDDAIGAAEAALAEVAQRQAELVPHPIVAAVVASH
jgi:glutamate-1-semialdehyde 2,1-aminomutase